MFVRHTVMHVSSGTYPTSACSGLMAADARTVEAGKVTHIETETRRMWEYKELPEEMDQERSELAHDA